MTPSYKKRCQAPTDLSVIKLVLFVGSEATDETTTDTQKENLSDGHVHSGVYVCVCVCVFDVSVCVCFVHVRTCVNRVTNASLFV